MVTDNVPSEPTDPSILQALRDGVRERMGYPAAVGLPELREAIVGWVGNGSGNTLRFTGVEVATAGEYDVVVHYCSGESRSAISVRVIGWAARIRRSS